MHSSAAGILENINRSMVSRDWAEQHIHECHSAWPERPKADILSEDKSAFARKAREVGENRGN